MPIGIVFIDEGRNMRWESLYREGCYLADLILFDIEQSAEID
jgi:hypothetical protein